MEQKDIINKAVVEAMTDKELYKSFDMINAELDFRVAEFMTGFGDARTPQH